MHTEDRYIEEYDPNIESKGMDFKGKLSANWGDMKLAQNKWSDILRR